MLERLAAHYSLVSVHHLPGIPQSKQVVALFRARPLYYSRDFSLKSGFIKLK